MSKYLNESNDLKKYRYLLYVLLSIRHISPYAGLNDEYDLLSENILFPLFKVDKTFRIFSIGEKVCTKCLIIIRTIQFGKTLGSLSSSY